MSVPFFPFFAINIVMRTDEKYQHDSTTVIYHHKISLPCRNVAEKHEAINVWPEDDADSNFLGMVCIRVADNTVSHPRRPSSSVVYCTYCSSPCYARFSGDSHDIQFVTPNQHKMAAYKYKMATLYVSRR
jgi:hypothetical protein